MYILYIVTVIVAAASIIYEFMLVRTSTIILGGSFRSYVLCIGLFTFSLGIGAIFFSYIQPKKISKLTLFSSVEFGLIFIASFLIPSAFYLDSGSLLSIFYLYFVIFLIGFLSGLEIPCLMDLSKNKDYNNFDSTIVFYDYLGTLLGLIVFIILEKNQLNYFDSLAIVISINIVALLVIIKANIVKYLIFLAYVGSYLYFRLDILKAFSYHFIHN